MKKLLTFAGVLALAIAFAVDGTAAPGGNTGPPGGRGPGGGGPTSTVSQFSSRLVDVSCAVTTELNCEVAGSTGEIDGQGIWNVKTSDLLTSGTYAICLEAVSAPEFTPLPFFLALLDTTDFVNSGTIGANIGDWVGPSFQIIEGSDCSGVVLQESGLSLRSKLLDGEEASMFTSPFVDLTCGSDNCEVTDSYVLITNNGDWVVLTYDLVRGVKYDICVDAFTAPPVVPLGPFRLASRSAQRKGTFLTMFPEARKGTFLASGNMVERYEFNGHWVGLSFQIYVQDVAAPCAGEFVQEIGINIVVSPP